MDNSWAMPKQVATIVGKAHLTTREQLLDKFAKNQAEPIVACIMQLQQA